VEPSETLVACLDLVAHMLLTRRSHILPDSSDRPSRGLPAQG
jgi:hypothetical protein